MAKPRPAPPKAVKEAVLKEFNHRCAICGADRPHVHHIDEDPANNEPLNLLPLCPNCHLTDQHDPTRSIELRRLQIFRRYRDPLILAPEFVPLYRRLDFLFEVQAIEEPYDLIAQSVSELVSFVSALPMGAFYGPQIGGLLNPPRRAEIYFLGQAETPETIQRRRAEYREYRQRLIDDRERAVSLVVELLRYQPWKPPQRSDTR